MGRCLIDVISHHRDCRLVGGVDRADALTQGEDIGILAGLGRQGCVVGGDVAALIADCDAIIDFSTPQATASAVVLAAEAGCIHVIGSTGFDASQERLIEVAAKATTIVKSANMSRGVTLLTHLLRQATATFGAEFDIEIGDRHHRHKVDAPSGTALLLGQAAASGRGCNLEDQAVYVRHGHPGARRAGTIGFTVSRGGGWIAEHDVTLVSEDECLTLSHRVLERSVFARGAVTAALWARGQKSGLYTMSDVLGIGAGS